MLKNEYSQVIAHIEYIGTPLDSHISLSWANYGMSLVGSLKETDPTRLHCIRVSMNRSLKELQWFDVKIEHRGPLYLEGLTLILA